MVSLAWDPPVAGLTTALLAAVGETKSLEEVAEEGDEEAGLLQPPLEARGEGGGAAAMLGVSGAAEIAEEDALHLDEGVRMLLACQRAAIGAALVALDRLDAEYEARRTEVPEDD